LWTAFPNAAEWPAMLAEASSMGAERAKSNQYVKFAESFLNLVCQAPESNFLYWL
jgi:hypothetical protein